MKRFKRADFPATKAPSKFFISCTGRCGNDRVSMHLLREHRIPTKCSTSLFESTRRVRLCHTRTFCSRWRPTSGQNLMRAKKVRTLVDDHDGERFRFTKNVVLKAGLVLIDVPDVRFKVSNFTAANMEKLERAWPQVRNALLTAQALLSSFGFSAQTLTGPLSSRCRTFRRGTNEAVRRRPAWRPSP